MTSYTMNDLERLAEMVGEGSRNTPSYSQSRNVPAHDFRVDVRRDIYNAVLLARGAVTRAEIAKAIGKKKSTWLTERIEDLVRDGLLCRENAYWKNGVIMYFYQVQR